MSVHECSLIANPGSYAGYYTQKIKEELAKRGNGFELNRISLDPPHYRFKDGEIKPKILDNVRKKNCYFIHDTTLPPSDWFLQLCLINGAIKNSAAQEIVDVLPYLKFSRQDRKDESRVPISARVVADTICLYADRMMTIDYHNAAIEGFYSIPVDNLSSYPTVVKFLNDNYPQVLVNIVVMSTDVGGAKQARKFAKKLGTTDIAIGDKHRERPGEVERYQIIGNVKDKNVLIVDDMIDSGGSMISASIEARRLGALKVYGYATHGLFTDGVRKVTDNFDMFFIGDTIKLPLKENEMIPENVKIISFIPLFAEAISRTSEGLSLSELFI